MKKLMTTLAILLLTLVSSNNLLRADVESDLKNIKENLPFLMNSTAAGTTFFLTFHPCWEETGTGNSIRIYVSSPVDTKVTIEIPYWDYKRTRLAEANNTAEFELPPSLAQPYSKDDGVPPEPSKVWEGRAVIVTSEQPIVCYGVTRYQYTSDGYLALPITALGKTYQVASYVDPTDNTGQWLTSYSSVVGVYDNTKVTFRLGGNENQMLQKEDGKFVYFNNTITATLNRGDVWLLAGYGGFNDLTGSRITANKPVTAMSGSFCAYIPTNVAACDFIIEQEMPESIWGTKYHVTAIVERKMGPLVKIFAKKPYTNVYVDGNIMGQIITPGGTEAIGYIEARTSYPETGKAPLPSVVSSDEGMPINVVQYNPGQSEDGIESDPFQMTLTPIEQYQKQIIFNTPGVLGGKGFKRNFINIVYKATSSGTIPDDIMFGEVINNEMVYTRLNIKDGAPGDPFTADPPDADGRRFYAKKYAIDYDGVYSLKANDPFAAYAYGFDSYDSYGFPTSVATADLEKPDTLAPTVTFTKGCDGEVEGFTIDEPVIDPENRSNLGLMYKVNDDSYNFTDLNVDMKNFIFGETAQVTWTSKVIDPTMDGRLRVVFQDRRGNTTDTIIEHFALSPSIVEYYYNFGLHKIETPAKKVTGQFHIKNEGKSDIDNRYIIYLTLDSQEDEPYKPNDINTYQNFDIVDDNGNSMVGVDLAPLAAGEMKSFNVQFTADTEGRFRDSIGIKVIDKATGEVCVFKYFTEIEAFVGNQYIMVDDYDFKSVVVGTSATSIPLNIRNPKEGDYISTNDLVVTGYRQISGDQVDGANAIFTIKGLENVSPSNPLIIKPGENRTFTAVFTPQAVQNYRAEVEIIADAEVPDNISVLVGVGVQPALEVTSYNWGRKRVDPNSYVKKQHNPYSFTPYPATISVIELKNDGSSDVTLSRPEIVSDIKGSAFVMLNKDNKYIPLKDTLTKLFTNMKIPANGVVTVPILFHPAIDGPHELAIDFKSDAPVSAISTLRGYGKFPKDSTEDLNFGTFIVGTPAYTGSVKFYNTNWLSEDTLTIDDFVTEVDPGSTFGQFGTNDIFRWDRNNITDKNGNQVNFPIVLAPGDYVVINGEFQPTVSGSFSGRLIAQTDAEYAATSNWQGVAISEGLTKLDASAITCVNQSIQLRPEITNTGSVDMKITFARITVPGSGVVDHFEFELPADSLLRAGQTYQIPVNFMPLIPYPAGTKVYLIVKTDGIIYDSLAIELTVEATHNLFPSTAVITLTKPNTTNNKVIPGTPESVKYKVVVDRTNAISTSYGRQISVVIDYKLDFLGISFRDAGRTNAMIDVSPAMQALGYTIAGTPIRKVNTTTGIETLTINLSSTTNSIATQSGPIEILTATFDAFLPIYTDGQGNLQLKSKTSEISHTIDVPDPCFDISGDKGTVVLDETCVDPLRPIFISTTKYNLVQVSPNPVSKIGTTIDFSVGGSNIPTEIRLYNANSELIGTLFNKVVSSGEYNVLIPVENLSSGVYFYEMVSGPFRDFKKFVIQK